MKLNSGAKKIFRSLLGNSDVIDIAEPTKTYPLERMLSELIKLTEEDWGMYAFSRDPLEGKFNPEQKRAYVKRAQDCGVEEARKLKSKYSFDSVKQLAKLLEFTVNAKDVPNGGGHVIFAQFVEPDQITIFTDTIKKAEPIFKDSTFVRILGDVDIFDILLTHEIFHGIEYANKDLIYTQTEKVELWRKPFSNRSPIICLGEIAGMAFAKELLGLEFSPFLFDVFFMYGYNKEAATCLYEDILETAQESKA